MWPLEEDREAVNWKLRRPKSKGQPWQTQQNHKTQTTQKKLPENDETKQIVIHFTFFPIVLSLEGLGVYRAKNFLKPAKKSKTLRFQLLLIFLSQVFFFFGNATYWRNCLILLTKEELQSVGRTHFKPLETVRNSFIAKDMIANTVEPFVTWFFFCEMAFKLTSNLRATKPL